MRSDLLAYGLCASDYLCVDSKWMGFILSFFFLSKGFEFVCLFVVSGLRGLDTCSRLCRVCDHSWTETLILHLVKKIEIQYVSISYLGRYGMHCLS